MLYDAYEVSRVWLAGASAAARLGASWFNSPANFLSYTGAGEVVRAALDVFSHASAPRGKPLFGLHETKDGKKTYQVRDMVVDSRPFGNLLRFTREGAPKDDPKLLIVAPMSGHYATLLRGTVERMLPRHDVYITDWADAKLVPMSEGPFDLDNYIDYVMHWLDFLTPRGSPRVHVLAVCQPSVPVYAATALMNARRHHARPATVTMMGGPIDTRQGVTAVNDLAVERPLEWFERNVIATVPAMHPGRGRRVYPGFLQLGGFISMNLGSHMISHWNMFKELVQGDEEHAEASKAFYEEYRSVCDMTAEFYLQTISTVFQEHLLPRGKMTHRGLPIDPGAIRDTAIMAVEGERDDISGIGQTRAALTLATGLSEDRKKYLLVPDVGHYGIFNGGKWRRSIAPQLEVFIREHADGKPAAKTAAKATVKATVKKAAAKKPAARKAAKPETKAASRPVKKAAAKAKAAPAAAKTAAGKTTTAKTAAASPKPAPKAANRTTGATGAKRVKRARPAAKSATAAAKTISHSTATKKAASGK